MLELKSQGRSFVVFSILPWIPEVVWYPDHLRRSLSLPFNGSFKSATTLNRRLHKHVNCQLKLNIQTIVQNLFYKRTRKFFLVSIKVFLLCPAYKIHENCMQFPEILISLILSLQILKLIQSDLNFFTWRFEKS